MEGRGTVAIMGGRPKGIRFSVGVYNAVARALAGDLGEDLGKTADVRTEDGEADGGLGPQWAELRHEEVIAESAEQARRLAGRLYPAVDGFIITEVRPVDVAA